MSAWRKRRQLGDLALLVCLSTTSGCMNCFNPVPNPHADWIACCSALPRQERNHVYIFMMNGLDPVNCCNLTGVRDCVQKLGFIKTYYGQPVHYWWFASEIRRVSEEDPDARFVFVGSQAAAIVLQRLACELNNDGITIDLAFYLDGCLLSTDEGGQPANVLRTVHLWSGHALLKGKEVPGAENVCVQDANVLGCGPHPQTLERLALELAVVAASISIESSDPVQWEQAPMPTPAPGKLPPLSEEWSFLEPRSKSSAVVVPKATKASEPPAAIPSHQASDQMPRR